MMLFDPDGVWYAHFASDKDATDYRRLRQAMSDQNITMDDVLALICPPTIFDNGCSELVRSE